MHPARCFSIFLSLLTIFSLTVSQAEDEKKSLTIKGKRPDGPFTEQKPGFLHFREVIITRESSQRLKFDITLAEDIPNDLKDSVSFYFGFDIDNDASTGTVFTTVPNAGFDMGFHIYRTKGMGLFKSWSNAANLKGRSRDIDISGLKVKGNKIELMARSELFRMYDSFKFYMVSNIDFYEKGKKVNEVDVDSIPSTKF